MSSPAASIPETCAIQYLNGYTVLPWRYRLMPCDARDRGVSSIKADDVHDFSPSVGMSTTEHCAVLAQSLSNRVFDAGIRKSISQQPQVDLSANAWTPPQSRQDLGGRESDFEQLCPFSIVEFARTQGARGRLTGTRRCKSANGSEFRDAKLLLLDQLGDFIEPRGAGGDEVRLTQRTVFQGRYGRFPAIRMIAPIHSGLTFEFRTRVVWRGPHGSPPWLSVSESRCAGQPNRTVRDALNRSNRGHRKI